MENKSFVAECDHNESNHNVIEYIVRDEDGNERPHRIIQCNLCGRKVG